MIYRNTVTGVEFETTSICSGKDLVEVKPEVEKKEPEKPVVKKTKGTRKK